MEEFKKLRLGKFKEFAQGHRVHSTRSVCFPNAQFSTAPHFIASKEPFVTCG